MKVQTLLFLGWWGMVLFLVQGTLTATQGQSTQGQSKRVQATPAGQESLALAPEEEKIPGYRVQVYQGPSRSRAKEIRDQMVQEYSKLGVYMTFRQPDFRIRLGDFRDKAEAQAYLDMLKPLFATAFVVPDKVLLHPKVQPEDSPTQSEDGFDD